MKYSITSEKTVFDNHYKIIEASVSYDSFQGKSITATRFAFERGDSVAILLYEKDTASFLLTKQFRYPTTKHHKGWILELPAGSLKPNESPEACIIREVEEELGYEIQNAEHLYTFYTSPGGATERMFLFYAETSKEEKTKQGGGLESEKEDIQTVRIPATSLKENLKNFEDAKTILAFQWYLLNKD